MYNCNMNKEIWKDVVGYEGIYQVSNKGRIKSRDRSVPFRNTSKKIKGIELKQHTTKEGYKRVELNKNRKAKKFFVHRLVALSFIKNKENLPVVNHIDSNPLNNVVSNLEWTTIKGNTHHAMNEGRLACGEKQGKSKLKDEDVVEIRRLHDIGVSKKEIANKFEVTRRNISHITNYNTWKHI